MNARQLDTFMILAGMITMAIVGFGVGENIQIGNIFSISTIFYLSFYFVAFYMIYNRMLFYMRSRIEK